MYRYLIVIEPGERNYSAYVPDLPGCITTGKTYGEVQKNMVESIPVPQTTAEYADIALPGSAA